MITIVTSGRIVEAPDMAYSAKGTPWMKMRVAAESKGKTTFFDVLTFNNMAENCYKYLIKGQEVKVTGSYEQKTWTDKNGTSRLSVQISAYDVEFGAKPKGREDEMPSRDEVTIPDITPEGDPGF